MAYVKFALASSAARAIESISGSGGGGGGGGEGDGSCRKFLGGVERKIRVMLAEQSNTGWAWQILLATS